jgi:hypothetical protein
LSGTREGEEDRHRAGEDRDPELLPAGAGERSGDPGEGRLDDPEVVGDIAREIIIVPETMALKSLLEACDDPEIPFTFDVVGHLLHESCPGMHETPSNLKWLDDDPGTDVEPDPLSYAPDLINMIESANQHHEIASHTCSHVLFDEVDEEVADWELNEVGDVHSQAGLQTPTSLVAPDDRHVGTNLLKKHDIDASRVPFKNYDQPTTTGNLDSLLWLLNREHPVGELSEEDGLTCTPCTPHPSLSTPLLGIGQRSPNPLLKYVLPLKFRERIHRRYLIQPVDEAIRTDSHVHLWTHLYNVSNDHQLTPIRRFLQYLSKRQETGDVNVRTMNDLKTYR